jgi:hypothetical protein
VFFARADKLLQDSLLAVTPILDYMGLSSGDLICIVVHVCGVTCVYVLLFCAFYIRRTSKEGIRSSDEVVAGNSRVWS